MMVRRIVTRLLPLALVVAIGSAGCSSGPKAPKPVPVSGTVTVDGKPVANVVVKFNSASFVGEGKTNAEGKYELVQGATPGDNTVTFSETIEGFNPDAGMDEGQLEAAGGGIPGVKRPAKAAVPPAYGNAETSNVKYSVPDGGTNGADFRLQSTGP
ncbi:MAG: hypothetical protein FJ297_12040 [Planctomycetes bacterium]|nr:hypothetical protein [Planctomycetota bacterium]